MSKKEQWTHGRTLKAHLCNPPYEQKNMASVLSLFFLSLIKKNEQDRDVWKIAVQCISVGPLVHFIQTNIG